MRGETKMRGNISMSDVCPSKGAGYGWCAHEYSCTSATVPVAHITGNETADQQARYQSILGRVAGHSMTATEA